ncbi:hypothetical protein GN956_G25281 [Arapaima gigas]
MVACFMTSDGRFPLGHEQPKRPRWNLSCISGELGPAVAWNTRWTIRRGGVESRGLAESRLTSNPIPFPGTESVPGPAAGE